MSTRTPMQIRWRWLMACCLGACLAVGCTGGDDSDSPDPDVATGQETGGADAGTDEDVEEDVEQDVEPDAPEPDVEEDVPEPDVEEDVPEPDVEEDVPELDVEEDVDVPPAPTLPPVRGATGGSAESEGFRVVFSLGETPTPIQSDSVRATPPTTLPETE